MAATISKGSLFPVELADQMINLVRGKSSLARLSGTTPVPFVGKDVFTFNFDGEVALVAENAAKSNGGGSVTPVSMTPVKVEYGMRVSDEFMYASEEKRIQLLQDFADGFAKRLARGLDIMAFHGVDPRSKQVASSLANKYFDALVSQKVSYNSSKPQDNVVDAIGLVEANEHEVNGLAASPAFKTALANLKKGSGDELLFPELGWGATVGQLNGLPFDANSTVSFNSGDDRAIVGNFADYFKWGIAKDMPIEVIQYGNPDNSEAGDLKGHNQVYLRGEAYIGWGILDPNAFAIITAGQISG